MDGQLGDNFAVDFKVDSLHCVTGKSEDRYICYTLYSGATVWTVCATDGNDVWKQEYDRTDLHDRMLASGLGSFHLYFDKISQGFQTPASVTAIRLGSTLKLSVGAAPSPLNFDLHEATATDRRESLRGILFRLADTCASLRQERHHGDDGRSATFASSSRGCDDFGMLAHRDAKRAGSRKPGTEGMSLVNPNSKKLKLTGKGAMFQ